MAGLIDGGGPDAFAAINALLPREGLRLVGCLKEWYRVRPDRLQGQETSKLSGEALSWKLEELGMAIGSGGDEQTRLKMQAAQRALELVEPGMTVGLGSGSTATMWIRLVGEQVRDHGLKIRAIASSEDSEKLGRSYGIPFTNFDETKSLDLTVDGADEVAPGLALIKGGGGKLLREKIVASASKRFVVVVDQ